MTSRGRPQSARILFAEDNSDMRDYIRRLLAEQYEVETVADGQAALERILANPPDLVLADVMMPRLDGFGLVHRLRADERTRTLPFIMLSARAGEEARVEGLNAGVDDYLVKPFSARELLARVGTHLEMARLRRAATTALLESEKRFRELADNAPVMIWITDDRGNIEFANKTYLEYFQVMPAEIVGQKWKDLIHPDDYESYSQNFIAASAAGQPFRAEGRVRRRDDAWRWVDSWAVPRSTDSGRVPGMVGCSVDITERKRTEERIRELVAIVESSDDAILGTTLNGIITSWNTGAEKIYGYAENEVIGQSNSILVPTDRRHEIPQILGGLALGEAISSYETVRRRKDGKEIHVSLTICPIRNCEDRIVGASSVARDITERKRLEEEILAVSEREQRRIGQDLHDDLCQRLAGIQLMGDVLQRDLLAKTKPEAEQASLIAARIRDAIANTKNIARGLSPVALESDGLVVALEELAENSAKLFQIVCEFRFDGSVGVDDNTVATHLYRIAQEAVTNAVKHGGAKKIVICLAESEDKCILTITDDGLGLPEPYTKNQGTGLQIMKYRAAAIGASLAVRRASGRGICVSCSFCKQPRPKDS
jgi:PAS domain S-box-containing protein